ncbi:MAG: Smr/MutS family protein, partial [Lachnospiraceae bacterium]|nr:Smr/MutS family protein [Lachnospiraceae bacterium]
TTHYSELKIFALSTQGVENACCEFDVETLRPTYRLLIGIPGKSNAFAISKKLGLSDEIIRAAREQIGQEEERFEDVIASLQQNRVEMERQRSAFSRELEEFHKQQEELRKKRESLDQSKNQLIQEANEKARQILAEAKELADETIRKFHKAGQGLGIRDLEDQRKRVREEIEEKNRSIVKKEKTTNNEGAKTADPKKLKKGDLVQVLSMGLKGSVYTLPDANGNLSVQCGILRSTVHISDIAILDEETTQDAKTKQTTMGSMKMAKSMSVSTQINLVGKTVDEAIMELDKYLDDCYLSHLPEVRVVHGKGTGALRSAVHAHLKRQKYVKEYRLGEYGEGDVGVTIVTFK